MHGVPRVWYAACTLSCISPMYGYLGTTQSTLPPLGQMARGSRLDDLLGLPCSSTVASWRDLEPNRADRRKTSIALLQKWRCTLARIDRNVGTEAEPGSMGPQRQVVEGDLVEAWMFRPDPITLLVRALMSDYSHVDLSCLLGEGGQTR